MKHNDIPQPGAAFRSGSSAAEAKTFLKYSFMHNLRPELQEELLTVGTVEHFKKGDFLFMDGERIKKLSLILTGKIKEYFTNHQGEECLRHLHTPGGFISLHLIFTDMQTHTYTSEAITPSSCLTWEREAFTHIVAREPELAGQVTRELAVCMENTCRHNCLCRKPLAISRVAGYLLSRNRQMYGNPLLSAAGGDGDQTNLRPLELSASEICLARETFSRALSSLQDQGIIKVKNGVVDILDKESLMRVSMTR